MANECAHCHFEQGNRYNHEELRQRKLLLHKSEIAKLHAQATLRNWTIVPLRLYINNSGRAKVEIGFTRGKQPMINAKTIASAIATTNPARVEGALLDVDHRRGVRLPAPWLFQNSERRQVGAPTDPTRSCLIYYSHTAN